MRYGLRCTRCGAATRDYSSFRCHVCHSILEIEYSYASAKLPKNFRKQKISTSKYLPFFPVASIAASLGEGGTPLVRKSKIGAGSDLYLKMETENPTNTFKDRGSVIEITKALELNFSHVCCASTGNMGLSVAYYAKRHGIGATIFISSDADRIKIKKIEAQGARTVMVKGDFNKALKEAESFATRNKAFVCGDYHYRKEGQKSIGFEIAEQLGYEVPDYIFMPVGNATLISSIYKSLREFRRFGLISRMPKLMGVQSKGCDPVVRAFEEGTDIAYMVPRTIADAIAVGYPTFGFECMRALKETRGVAIAVSDDEIKDARKELARNGVKAEAGGATAYAGFKAFSRNGRGLDGKRAVVIVSGNN
ncbi:MAG: threonine synthase [Candidatus Micrarchaeota archaeon]|nr:threonine synthase [Candidatus Micrarchaeota archaeon]